MPVCSDAASCSFQGCHLSPYGCGYPCPSFCPRDGHIRKPDFPRLLPRAGQLSSCSSLGVPPAPSSALGCRRNDWQQITGHQRICRKSIICQHSTCMFRVVKRCAQTDSCVSMGYKGGTVPKAWFGMKKQRLPSTSPIAIQDPH